MATGGLVGFIVPAAAGTLKEFVSHPESVQGFATKLQSKLKDSGGSVRGSVKGLAVAKGLDIARDDLEPLVIEAGLTWDDIEGFQVDAA